MEIENRDGLQPNKVEAPGKMTSAVNFGAVLGLTLAAFTVLNYLIGAYDSLVLSFIISIVFVAGIVVGIKRRRDNELGGEISYGDAVGYGVLLALFSGIVVAFVTYIYLGFVDSSFVEYSIEKQREVYYESGLEAEEIDAMMGLIGRFLGPGTLAFATIFNNLLTGLITSLIAAFFLKKGDNNMSKVSI